MKSIKEYLDEVKLKKYDIQCNLDECENNDGEICLLAKEAKSIKKAGVRLNSKQCKFYEPV